MSNVRNASKRVASPTEHTRGSGRKPVRAAKRVEPEVTPDLDMEWLREKAAEPVEADALTDRVFASVLRRCGWRQNEAGGIEHVGGRE